MFTIDLDYGGRGYRDHAPDDLIKAGVPVDVVLAAVKKRLSADLDERAEALRQLFITPGAGQAMEYQEAYAEAARVDAALQANPDEKFDLAQYPMLSASIGYDIDPDTNKPTIDVPGEARAVLAAKALFQKIGGPIRNARLNGKKAIADATSIADAEAAAAAVAWPPLT